MRVSSARTTNARHGRWHRNKRGTRRRRATGLDGEGEGGKDGTTGSPGATAQATGCRWDSSFILHPSPHGYFLSSMSYSWVPDLTSYVKPDLSASAYFFGIATYRLAASAALSPEPNPS